ncbi:phosphatase PAP2 family protein [Desulfovibrio oxamicus]|uniref:Phosphatase PAP2 family protein n=1 Tax=Nitratidesulfovibrio oxamicus TaxID=32016 RepID=A0ABS0J2M5_9BACT|nr:phosphatase PAP2 family protein [Nitratidesulfovibrio oxamicus]MBG3876684.1 phosphatase PAP2 family protein [Nitratidesulfovibrio oxamicus]
MRQPYPLAHHLLCTLPLLALLAISTVYLGTGDEVIAYWRAWRHANPDTASIVQVLTDWGNPALYAVYGVLLWRARHRHDPRTVRFVLAYVAVQLLISFLLVRVIKVAAGRTRPGVEGPWVPFSFDGPHNSMPSGHTAEIAGACPPLAMRWKRTALSLALGGYVAAVGYSRVLLGQHHVSDVLAGLLLGSLAAFIIHRITHRTAPL